MNCSVNNESGLQEEVEYAVENLLQDLRSSEPMSPFNRDRKIRLLRNEISYLGNYYPDSYILQEGFDLSY